MDKVKNDLVDDLFCVAEVAPEGNLQLPSLELL